MIREALQGALAGLAATGPMTAAMELWFRRLPRRHQYPLPPRQITMKVAEQAGVRQQLEEPQKKALTLAAHFAYGAAVGALYGLAAKRRGAGLVSGIAYGTGVWVASYFGLLPAMRILKTPIEHPPERSALMIGAHWVWGACVGGLVQVLQSTFAHSTQPSSQDELKPRGQRTRRQAKSAGAIVSM